MKKKIVTLALVAALVAVAVVGATLAYFTDTKEATNTFTVGNVTIDLTEPAWDDPLTGTGAKDAPTVYAGEPLAKNPMVENIGANPCFVRLKVEGLDSLVPDPLPEGVDEGDYMITLRSLNITDWTWHNGYYYYYVSGEDGGVLYPDGTLYTEYDGKVSKTPALFTHIVMPTALENETDAGAEYDVVVTAEAVQAQLAKPSFAAVKLMTVEEIADWFTTCGF